MVCVSMRENIETLIFLQNTVDLTGFGLASLLSVESGAAGVQETQRVEHFTSNIRHVAQHLLILNRHNVQQSEEDKVRRGKKTILAHTSYRFKVIIF
jgi:hypothetical protein